METPPSMRHAVPVTKLDASAASHNTARAISSGFAMRLRAWRDSTKANTSGFAPGALTILAGVSVPPGSTAFKDQRAATAREHGGDLIFSAKKAARKIGLEHILPGFGRHRC